MKLHSFEILEEEGYTYKAEVWVRVFPRWKFWNNTVKLVTYVGNSLGWYDPTTGAKLRNVDIETQLANEMRRIYLTDMLAAKNRANLKPVK